MSETLDCNKNTALVEASDEGGQSSGTTQGVLDDQSECPKSPPINVTPTSLNDDQPAAVPGTGQQPDETIENLVGFFRDFLEAAPHKSVRTSSHPVTQQSKAGRKRFFGLPGFSQERGSNDPFNYEQKYPRDEFGKETTENARVWLTYLDEAESFDRERAEGWKETVDVLLVFAGLFSGVITTFISQASQNLQQDNTQVSASLLFAIGQILLAQSNGMPTNITLNSMMNPNSPFTPSTNVVLVNGLWFTSLALTLSAALFAVLAKQWLYYYLSSISGTANEKARARQLRFDGFESWKVAAIVELLPILLHLAVGMFLTGIIILLFPLDVHIAGTIVFIAGITFSLYFISVMLPIWYPECPYTTSLTIYIGILFFILRQVFQAITPILNEGFQALWEKINYKAQCTVEHLVHYIQSLVGHGFMFISKLGDAVRRDLQELRPTIFYNLPEFTKWREENIRKAVKDATFLDYEVLDWLYGISPNRSVHRIIARCAAVNPAISDHFNDSTRQSLYRTLKASETNVGDLHYGLCFDLRIITGGDEHWRLLRSIPNAVESQLEEGEYRTYLRIADTVVQNGLERGHKTLLILREAIDGDFSLPLGMWCDLLEKTSTDATVAVHLLVTVRWNNGLFHWNFDPSRELIHDMGLLHFKSGELGWWKFKHLFRYFGLGKPDFSSEAKTYETCYLLLITIYRNLTSDDPLITDKERRQKSLEKVFHNFRHRFNHPRRLEDALRFFTEICCADSFWCESMTDTARNAAVWSPLVMVISYLTNTRLDNHLPFMDIHDPSLIYQWYSRDLSSELSFYTPPLFLLLLVPHNRHHLSTILSNDQARDQVTHFSKCIYNLANCDSIDRVTSIYPILMDLLKSVGPKNPLFTILYDPSVLLQLWKLLMYCKWKTKSYFLLLKSKIEREKLDELFAAMNELARSDNFENLPLVCWRLYKDRDSIRSALAASACEFGQLIRVSHTQPEATTDPSAPENAVSNNDHNNEERAQVPGQDERKIFHLMDNWIKKVFRSIWLKIPLDRRTSDQSTASPIPLREMSLPPIA